MIDLTVDRTERFYKIDRLLREHRIVSFASMQAQLEVSRATLKRDLEYMRNRLHAPIEFDRSAGGYRFAAATSSGSRYELPGLWFSAPEIHALLTLQHLVSNLRAGSVLSPHVEAVTRRLESALGAPDHSADELRRRVRILDLAARSMRLEYFETVGSALFRRRRLRITYFGRTRGDLTDRIVSPQRLVHYRDNWYLDAYCHLRKGLRSFSVDAIHSASMRYSATATEFFPARTSLGHSCALHPNGRAGLAPNNGIRSRERVSRPTDLFCWNCPSATHANS